MKIPYRTLQTRRFRRKHPNYNKRYMKAWYDAHPGYHAKQERERRRLRKTPQK
jgi:hypothetical protein